MRRLSRVLLWVCFAGALALAVGLGLLARHSLGETPRQAYETGARAAFGPDRDPEAAFRQFDFALRGALAEADHDLAVEVLKARARLFTGVGSLSRARRDYEEVLTRHRSDDLQSQLALIRLLVRLGEDEEALERIERVLASHPRNASALASRAQLLVRAAEEELETAREVIDVLLPEGQRARANATLRRIASLPPAQPRRARLTQQLREMFPPAQERQVQAVLARATAAGRDFRRAQGALIGSFSGQSSGETLVTFLELAEQAQEQEAAISFALGTAHLPSAAAQPRFLQRTLDLLRASGRPHLAAEALGILVANNVPGPDFYARWCKLLYDERRWSDLAGVSNALMAAGDRGQRSQALAYLGLAQVELGQWEDATRLLRRYLLFDPVQPFPGALAECWAGLARCWREADRPDEELSALRRAVLPSVRKMSGPALDGELWLRLYELAEGDEAVLRNRDELERILTFAICRLPERVGELLVLWEDVGRRNLDAANIDLQLVLEEMLLDKDYSTPTGASPYETYRLALMLHGRGLHAATLRACSRLLRDYPGFAPAIELALEARLAIGDLPGAGKLLLQRLEQLPKDPEILARLEELSSVALDPDEVLQLMSADPAGAARRRMLRHLQDKGLPGLAASGLLALTEEALEPDDQLQAARLLLDLGLAQEIEVALERLPPVSPYSDQALTLRMAAAVALEDWASFDLFLAELGAGEILDGPGLIRGLEPLLLRSPERAAALAHLLDEDGRWRDGGVLLRLAQGHDLASDAPAARLALQRADAFLTDGSPELGYLLATVAQKDWGRMPDRVGDLRRSRMGRSPLADAVLSTLGEEAGTAAADIEAHSARQVSEPLWVLVDAGLATLLGKPRQTLPGWSEESDTATRRVLRGPTRDPRQVLALVLALQHPQWRAWAVTQSLRLAHEDPVEELWPAYLAARGLLMLDEAERAVQLAEGLVVRWPEFRPGWRLLENADARRTVLAAGGPGAVPAKQPDDISWVRWRQRELIGLEPSEAPEEHWMSALEAERDGDLRAAQRTLGRALELRPDDLRFRLTQIRLYASDRDWVPALQSMNRAIEQAPESSNGAVAERAIALRRAAEADRAERRLEPLLEQQRELLGAHFPDDPLVALELARAEVLRSAAGPDIGLGRALRRLDAFRQRTKGVPLDRLRLGAARLWFDFLLPFDPRLAYDLALRELRMTPGDPALWRMLAESQEARGELGTAAAILRVMQRALAFPEDARALVRIEARLGADRDAFEDALTAVIAQEDLAGPDDSLVLARGTFLLNAGPYGWDEAVETLGRLWWQVRPARRVGQTSRGDEDQPGDEEQLGDEGQLGDEEPEASIQEPGRVQQELATEVGRAIALALLWPVSPRDEERVGDGWRAEPLAQMTRAEREFAAEVGKAYALALLWRGRPEDARKARQVLDQVLPWIRLSSDAWVFRGLREIVSARAAMQARRP